jgi:hypothetical protein
MLIKVGKIQIVMGKKLCMSQTFCFDVNPDKTGSTRDACFLSSVSKTGLVPYFCGP